MVIYGVLQIKKNSKLKWICDFRDTCGRANIDMSGYAHWHIHYVRKHSALADAVLHVDDFIDTHTDPRVKDYTVTNGYDPEEAAAPEKPTMFELIYTGTIYGNLQSFGVVYKAINELIAEGEIDRKKVRVLYAGKAGRLAQMMAEAYGGEGYFTNLDEIPRYKVLELQRKAAILIQAAFNVEGDYCAWTGKMYEYMMSQKPIVYVVNGDIPHSFPSKYMERLGGVCYEASRHEETYPNLKAYILSKYREWEETGKDKETLMLSSSGGAFTVLSDFFLKKGDAVVANVYNYQTKTSEFHLIRNKSERDAARGSKYMQSKPGDIFCEAYQWLMLNPGRELLFIGMGCQTDGFRKYAEMKNIRNRVYIVDIICHGSPSPKLWKEYAETLEKRKGKITYLTFKDKRKGWNTPTAFVKINGKEVSISDYVKIFYNRCALRPSCHECPYATTERKTDMTIGDFWHIEETIPEFYDPNGNSLFLIHTDRGEQLFDSIKDNLDYCLSDTQQCWQKNLEAPTPVSEQRDQFWKDYQREGIEFIMKKYGRLPFKTKVKNKMINIIQGVLTK